MIDRMSKLSLISTLFYVARHEDDVAWYLSELDDEKLPNILVVDLDDNLVENLFSVRKLKRSGMFADIPALGFTTGIDDEILNSAS